DGLVGLLVDDRPVGAGLVPDGVDAVVPRVDVLVDEAAAQAVHQHAPAGQGGQGGERDLDDRHAAGGGAGGGRHPDAGPVVEAVADLAVPEQDGGVVGEHLLVVHEPAGPDHDRLAGPGGDPLAVPAGDEAGDAAIPVQDEVRR